MLSALFKQWEYSLSKRDTNRRIRPFEWGIDFLKGENHHPDPKNFLLEYSRRILENSDAYHDYTPVRNYRIEGNHLTFTSPLPTQYPENKTVHGRFYPVESGGKAVLVVPQWNADSQGHISLCRMLNYFGLSALRISLPYHDFRMPAGLVRAEYMLSPNIGRTLEAVRQSVIDCRAAIDWLEQKGYSQFSILGTSIGSCVANITMAHDKRLGISVQNHISPYFADVVWTGISTLHVKAGLDGRISLEDLRRIWLPISPKAYLKKLVGSDKHSLLIHGRYDHSFLPHLSKLVLDDYRDLGLPHETLTLRCGHYTSGEFPFNVFLGLSMCRYLKRMMNRAGD
jgi:hypothetical protein